jgi:hypothetical protein
MSANTKTIARGLLILACVGIGLLALSISLDGHPWYWAGLERLDAIAGLITIVAVAAVLDPQTNRRTVPLIVVGTLLLDATLLWSANGDRIRLWEVWTWLVVAVLLGIGMWISADGRRERRIAGVMAVLGISCVLAGAVVSTVVGMPWS